MYAPLPSRTLARLCVALTAAIACPAPAASWKPGEPVEVVVGVSPGGAMDRTARTVHRSLVASGAIPATSYVSNKPGGGHAVAYAYTINQRGKPHVIQIGNSPLVTNYLLGRSTIRHTDLTPLAIIFQETMVYGVKEDSGIRDARDLFERLKKDVTSVSFSVSSGLGTANYFTATQVAHAAGADNKKLKVVSFAGAAQGVTAALGGHVDVVITTPSALAPHVKAKKLRIIATAADERLGGIYAEVPTWKELKVDSSLALWRAVLGPPGLAADQAAYWEGALKAMTSTEEWSRELEREFLTPRFMGRAETAAFLAAEEKRFRAHFAEFGILKQP
ncbi:MAG: tripartite tricarboxylate transporter substrate binding protein [Burkholderiales bacterium]|nr:tripartite tricarboxylate transporter substrate binding protein [Burkholderiales bacterium]